MNIHYFKWTKKLMSFATEDEKQRIADSAMKDWLTFKDYQQGAYQRGETASRETLNKLLKQIT